MLDIIWSVMIFIISLGVLITVHELGHFFVARYFDVRIESFSVGFGKSIWKYTDRKGTKFIVALIPLLGYVKMLDEQRTEEPMISKIRHFTFNNKTVYQRASIILAGPLANFIFSVMMYWFAFVVGVPGIRPIINNIVSNSVAANAKITPGTEIKSIDGIKTPDWDTVRLQLIGKVGNDSVIINIQSPNSEQNQDKILDLRHWVFNPNKEDPIISLGIHPHSIKIYPILTKIKIGSAASKAGLKVGDEIIKINGQSLKDWITFVHLVRNNPKNSLILEVKRGNNILFLTMVPDIKIKNDKIEGFAGVVPKVFFVSNEQKIIRKYGPFISLLKAVDQTWKLIKLTIKIMEKLIIGNIRPNNIGGPISIAHGASESARFGIIYYFMFLAITSVNLGIINLFPLPVLDGGHLLFLVIEKLKGSPVSQKVQNFSYRISSIFLTLLMIFALFNDFSRF